MRITDIVGRSKRQNKKLRNTLIIITLAIISIAIALIVLFTTFTGRAGLVVRERDYSAGIGISDTLEGELITDLRLEPVDQASDMYERILMSKEEAFLNQDGQYFDPERPQYIAYTFYIGNSSSEDLTVQLSILILQSRMSLERAMVFKIYIHLDDGGYDITYLTYNGVHIGASVGASASSFNQGMAVNVPGGGKRQKITFVSYISHDMSNSDMLSGTVNFEMLFEIKAGDED